MTAGTADSGCPEDEEVVLSPDATSRRSSRQTVTYDVSGVTTQETSGKAI